MPTCACLGTSHRESVFETVESGDGQCRCSDHVTFLYHHTPRRCWAETAEHGDGEGQATSCPAWEPGATIDELSPEEGLRLRIAPQQSCLEAFDA